MTNIRFEDGPCGSGKTVAAIAGLKPLTKYLIVTPLLEEVVRWKTEAKVPLSMGLKQSELELVIDAEYIPEGMSKTEWLRREVLEGNSIVTTHSLFDLVDLERTDLSEYEVIIDEVFDCVEQISGVKEEVFESVYIGENYATVDPFTGRVKPTQKWIDHYLEAEKLSTGLRNDLFEKARQGSLYKVLGQGFFVSLVPVELFTTPRSCTVLTYMADSSQMVGYLRRLGIPFQIDRVEDSGFRASLRQRLCIKDIPALREVSMTYTAQERIQAKGAKKITNALKNLRSRDLAGVEAKDIMLSCNKSKWHDRYNLPKGLFASGSKLTLANYLPRTTRGTNKYRHCSHAVYLNDLKLSPSAKGWLGWTKEQEEQWALSELIQWVMRSRLRAGDSASLYLASPRMKALLDAWLEDRGEELALAA